MQLEGVMKYMASVDWQKCKADARSGTVAVIRHNLRENEHYSNTDVDVARAQDNSIYLSGRRVDTLSSKQVSAAWMKRVDVVEQGMRDSGMRIRKDRVDAIELCLTAPVGISDDTEFFDAANKVLEDFFGKANLIYAVVHRDEIHEYIDPDKNERVTSRSHMHVLVVPEKDGRLCAKEVFTRANIHALNSKMDELCQRLYGIDYQTGSGKHGKSVDEAKALSARREAEIARMSLRQASERLSVLEGYLDRVDASKSLEEADIVRTPRGKCVRIPLEQYKDGLAALNAAKAAPDALSELQETVSGRAYKSLSQRFKDVSSAYGRLKGEYDELSRSYARLSQRYDRLMERVRSLPEDMQERILPSKPRRIIHDDDRGLER